jgi:DNA-binding NtrC family response regulator
MIRVGIIDDEPTALKMMGRILEGEGYIVETFSTGVSFLGRMAAEPFDIAFIDLQLPDMNGIEILDNIKSDYPDTEVIIVTGYASIESAVEATRKGAYHYLAKPCRRQAIAAMARQVAEKIQLRRDNLRLSSDNEEVSLLPGFIGKSKAMLAIFDTIRKVAQVNCNVLLEAETGTGKQLTARAIHELGPRSKAPFVYFNCGGFTDELICSELFGHEKGAFTDAGAAKAGLFEVAAGGTVLLDEIGEMPLSMQVKLLHVLQERQILRVGGTTPIDLNIRIIAATNRDLQEMVREKKFREDLYYRLNVVTIRLPRLSERQEDLPLLIHHFINKANRGFGKKITGISSDALDFLMHYDYPGNVRELENIIQHASALTEGNRLTVEDLPAWLKKMQRNSVFPEQLLPLEEVEKRYISRVLQQTGNNIKAAGKILQIPRTTLWRRMKKYNLTGKN